MREKMHVAPEEEFLLLGGALPGALLSLRMYLLKDSGSNTLLSFWQVQVLALMGVPDSVEFAWVLLIKCLHIM